MLLTRRTFINLSAGAILNALAWFVSRVQACDDPGDGTGTGPVSSGPPVTDPLPTDPGLGSNDPTGDNGASTNPINQATGNQLAPGGDFSNATLGSDPLGVLGGNATDPLGQDPLGVLGQETPSNECSLLSGPGPLSDNMTQAAPSSGITFTVADIDVTFKISIGTPTWSAFAPSLSTDLEISKPSLTVPVPMEPIFFGPVPVGWAGTFATTTFSSGTATVNDVGVFAEIGGGATATASFDPTLNGPNGTAAISIAGQSASVSFDASRPWSELIGAGAAVLENMTSSLNEWSQAMSMQPGIRDPFLGGQ